MKGTEVLVKKLLGKPVEDKNEKVHYNDDLTYGELLSLMTGRMYSLLYDGHVYKVNTQEQLDHWEAVRCGA